MARLTWKSIPGGPQCLGLFYLHGQQQLLLGWAMSETGSVWASYIPKVRGQKPINLWHGGEFIGVYPTLKQAQTAVHDWVRMAEVRGL